MIEIFDPLPPAPVPEAPAQAPTWTTPAPQAPGEDVPTYRARLLCHALAHGIAGLDLDQLRAIDHGAAQAVQSLPGRIDQDETKHLQPLDRQLHELRHQIHRRQEAHRRRWEAIAAQLTQDTAPAQEAPQDEAQDQDAPPETRQDRAARLLRAGLIELMGDQGTDQDGGKGARLQPPPTPRPPAAPGLTPPHAPIRGGRF